MKISNYNSLYELFASISTLLYTFVSFRDYLKDRISNIITGHLERIQDVLEKFQSNYSQIIKLSVDFPLLKRDRKFVKAKNKITDRVNWFNGRITKLKRHNESEINELKLLAYSFYTFMYCIFCIFLGAIIEDEIILKESAFSILANLNTISIFACLLLSYTISLKPFAPLRNSFYCFCLSFLLAILFFINTNKGFYVSDKWVIFPSILVCTYPATLILGRILWWQLLICPIERVKFFFYKRQMNSLSSEKNFSKKMQAYSTLNQIVKNALASLEQDSTKEE